MNAGIGPDHSQIVAVECRTYEKGRVAAAASGPNAATPDVLPAEAASAAQPTSRAARTPIPVEDFVKHVYYGSFPIDEAKAYSADVKKVESMLVDPKFAPYRPNIVALLGVIGTPETLPILKTIIETPVVGRPTDADIYARLAAPIAIGAIAARYHLPEKDVALLRQASDPNYWRDRLAPATHLSVNASPSIENRAASLPANGEQSRTDPLSQKSVDSLSRDLSINSVRGYAITGSLAVQNKLEEDRKANANAAIPESAEKQRASVIDQAIKLNEMSRQQGVFATYQ
jgi:hypothetical protein